MRGRTFGIASGLALAVATLAGSTTLTAPAISQPAATSLEDQFRDPPNSARPRVWWHWMNGNITKDGIAKDLAWMKRVGIGGLQNFDAALNTPRVVEKPLIYMTPEWKDAFAFTAQEADRLGLELTIAASPGWSETGGPWVPPADGLKKLVWSETEVPGGRRLAAPLAAPPSSTGPFQSIDKASGIGSMLASDKAPPPPKFYADVAVLAYPVATASPPLAPTVTGLDGASLNGGNLVDAALDSSLDLAKPTQGNPTIVYSYTQPQTVRSASFHFPGASAMFFGASIAPVLEASDDGQTWRKVGNVAVHMVPTTLSFAPVTAKHFRLVLAPSGGSALDGVINPAPGIDLAAMGAMTGLAGRMGGNAIKVGEFRLSGENRIDRFEAKAGFEIEKDYFELSQGLPEATGLDPAKVVDLTARMKPDGTLDWTPPKLPKGESWRVVRLGYSLLGTMNHPAPPEATGLEVDKFDGPAVRRYMEHYIGMYRDASGGLIGNRGVQAILTDSIEVGAANWTPAMVAQFKKLRGYDPTPWLPALTGAIVKSRADSDRFLFDYRRTLADLMASEHYGTVAAVARENGMKVYGEALENGRPSLGDDMAMRSHADIPMAAMWTHTREKGPQVSHVADMRGAASVANIYGRKFVAAESLTSGLSYWNDSPRTLKRVIDLEFVNGINRPVIHTSVHQPLDDKFPGFSLFIFGQYFNRHEAWAELAKPWVDYLSRTALLLQQGRNVADVGYFYGEEAPLTALMDTGQLTGTPSAYGYDYVNYDALAGALSNHGDGLMTPGGAHYRALYLGGSSEHMSLAALRKLAALVEGGATVIGTRPTATPGLMDIGAAAAEWTALADKLWPGGAESRIGKGRVIASTDLEGSLAKIGVAPDFTFSGAGASELGGAKIPFLHRRDAQGDLYFLVNQLDRTETIEAKFRVTGKVPELWHADTGLREPVSYRIENGQTIIPLTLTADQSVFVVFRQAAAADSMMLKKLAPAEVGQVAGPWTVAFQPGRGAPASTTLATLAGLETNVEPGIKYFSGIATYINRFTTPKGWKAGQPLWLDLGVVREVAEVRVNGQVAGAAWHAPYRVDVSAFAKPGVNTLEVRVANLWVNRLIGDAQPGATKLTWTALPTYRADGPLRPSGLIGPVRLLGQAK